MEVGTSSSSGSLERKLRVLTDAHISSELQRYALSLERSKRTQLMSLAAELDFVVVHRKEYDALTEDLNRYKNKMDAEIKEKIDKEVDKLQRELNHQLEIKALTHEREQVKLQEKIFFLEALTTSSNMKTLDAAR